MIDTISALIDLCVIMFDLMVFTRMITLKKDTSIVKIIMYSGCALIVAAYFIAAYVIHVPSSIASAFCMSIPSLLFFFILSQYKDARFFLTFCFVDSVTLILAFLARYITISTGALGNVITLFLLIGLLVFIFIIGHTYFSQYRRLLEYVETGWRAMMVSTVLIYFALVFLAIYPEPLVNRVEYMPVYLVFSVVVLSCYVVFITSVVKTSKIYEQSKQLQQEWKWHKIAYVDGLTGCANRMAYIEKINELERNSLTDHLICILVFDIDNFKKVNDRKGHMAGDILLQQVADILMNTFQSETISVYRIGGDEFVVIASDLSEKEINSKLQEAENAVSILQEDIPVTLSSGYAYVNPENNNAMETAFEQADNMMYTYKRQKKISCPGNENSSNYPDEKDKG
ncbi:GGDEF domain-containing protein [Clostridium transplantifaecale]|uniref:GGDEF domain-containing protein n=1 Tax=Clostridium transplantifaecale TaxID=2479838 RepID=UPI000F63C3C5|nr:GGDEF domain-containing protein [Clostridium transplantifaecale]